MNGGPCVTGRYSPRSWFWRRPPGSDGRLEGHVLGGKAAGSGGATRAPASRRRRMLDATSSRGGHPRSPAGPEQQPRARSPRDPRQHAADQSHDQRDDDNRVGVDTRAVRQRQRPPGICAWAADCSRQCADFVDLRPAGGEKPSRIRSMVPRPRRWPTLRRWPTCWQDA